MKHNYKWVLNLVILIAAILTIVVTILGVLITPVIMSITYSWYWMFLYIGYLVAILYVALCFFQYDTEHKGGTRK